MKKPSTAVAPNIKFKTDDFIISETDFFAKQDVGSILEFLHKEKITGKLTIDVNQGGITRASLTQKQPVEIET